MDKLKRHKLGLTVIGTVILSAVLIVVILTTLVSKNIEVTIDGQTVNHSTKEYKVDGFLEEANINLYKKDEITPVVSEYVNDGMEIVINRAVPFELTADGKVTNLKAVPDTVGEALKDNKIFLDGDDIVKPAAGEQLTANSKVVVNRIKKEKKTTTQAMKYKTKEHGDNSLRAGTTKVVRKGKKGKDKVTYMITYSDGKIIKKKEIGRKTITKPKTQLVARSTRGMIGGKEYKRKFTVKAYSYSGGGRTALGTQARVGAIAVDPSVIPLGSNVYVEGYGFARAEDTGGNIKGETIDVYKNSESASSSWGVRYVTIYIF
ncbi:MAG: 3D domain-containing protein [Anaerovoracaceae bacterium]